MPMARYDAKQNGRVGWVFAHLPFDADDPSGRASAITNRPGYDRSGRRGGRLELQVAVENLSCRPPYPSRRAWLHVAVRDANEDHF